MSDHILWDTNLALDPYKIIFLAKLPDPVLGLNFHHASRVSECMFLSDSLFILCHIYKLPCPQIYKQTSKWDFF